MYENDSVLREAVVSMKSKYLKYWREIPYLYAFAFVLDPRAKIGAFGTVLDLLSDATGLDYTNYFAEVRSRLYEVYQRYENRLLGVRSQRPPVAPTSSGKTSMWGTIFGASSSRSRSSSSAPQPAQPRPTRSGELSTYLDSDKVDFNSAGCDVEEEDLDLEEEPPKILPHIFVLLLEAEATRGRCKRTPQNLFSYLW